MEHLGRRAVPVGDDRRLADRVRGLPVDQPGRCRALDPLLGRCPGLVALHEAGLDERLAALVPHRGPCRLCDRQAVSFWKLTNSGEMRALRRAGWHDALWG